MSEKPRDVLIRPLLTERGTRMQEKHNQYLFQASVAASKTDIRGAVESMFRVKVERVRTMILRGKFRRHGRGGGAIVSDWKKAIVTVAEGQKIDFAQQAPS